MCLYPPLTLLGNGSVKVYCGKEHKSKNWRIFGRVFFYAVTKKSGRLIFFPELLAFKKMNLFEALSCIEILVVTSLSAPLSNTYRSSFIFLIFLSEFLLEYLAVFCSDHAGTMQMCQGKVINRIFEIFKIWNSIVVASRVRGTPRRHFLTWLVDRNLL